ncbi:unnamed protein product [Alternaria alternata]
MFHQARRRTAARKQRLRDPAQREDITKRNAIESPLLRLPPEIRNGIYTYVFGNTRYLFRDYHFSIRTPVTFTPDKVEYQRLSLPLVCRQLHHETRLLPYELGTFDFVEWLGRSHITFRAIKNFLTERSQSQIEALHTLTLSHDEKEKAINGNAMYWAKRLGIE